MKKKQHLVVLGGGGFSMEKRSTHLDDYILSLTRKRKPAVCFLATASGDAQGYIDRFHNAFPKNRARASHFSCFQRTAENPRKLLLSQDVIYVGGGNTANMLAIWRVHGIDRILSEAWKKGIVLCGISAGMLCWFECGVTDSFGPLAALDDGLGLLPGSACPHFDGEARRRPTYHRLIAHGFPSGFAADDYAAIHFVGQKLFKCISSHKRAKAYRVQRVRGHVVEEELPTLYLGAK